ncbi:hypothetical protein HFP89_01575 [Wenzhouxiangella sp. XN79A]|uniref:hypothetical protein n=1 Tax=Wenzhouxiangella sp. XN79A TaxID=2724193 RepID=UPI00144A5B17|nr:hypothetical protein [Wenzhouxiangella sp. XN79A]NKI33852.1 hypothetical protein [Wenzhouxiangella sp. XN79A]
MNRYRIETRRSLALAGLLLVLTLHGLSASPVRAQATEFPNNFTPPQVVPSGCFIFAPSFVAPPAAVAFDATVSVEDARGAAVDVRVRAWRVGCHEPGRSAILVNFALPVLPDSVLLAPAVQLAPTGGSVALDASLALFSDRGPATGIDPAPGRLQGPANEPTSADGLTFVVQGDETIDAVTYNGAVDLLVDFAEDRLGDGRRLRIPLAAYDPQSDARQWPFPPLHGRYSGQWVSPDLPRTGLQLQIGEIAPNRNFLFAIWFTYRDGAPYWVVGNTDLGIFQSEVTFDLLELSGGGFITEPGGFDDDEVSVRRVGTMTLRPRHCNEIVVELDFGEAGLGAQALVLERLIRIAGYDCDQTR